MQKPRERTDFHVKIKTELKKSFKELVEQQGFSTCFILETLIQAYLAGAPPILKAHPSSTITINQNIEYVVERPRRRMIGVVKKYLENVYFNGMWTYRKPEKGEVLSKLGHVPECECNSCMPYRHVIRVTRGVYKGSRTRNY